jgi:hypothetical protein
MSADGFDPILLAKSGYDCGWENVLSSQEDALLLGSARHPQEVNLVEDDGGIALRFHDPVLRQELARRLGVEVREVFRLPEYLALEDVLILAAELAQALPTHPLELFREALRLEGVEDGISQTETVRAVRQRVGQDIYRKGLMQYWGGACAVTGIDLPEVLRASHARPWAECDTDAQRLDVFNGFLLNANLDALFDRGLISFDATVPDAHVRESHRRPAPVAWPFRRTEAAVDRAGASTLPGVASKRSSNSNCCCILKLTVSTFPPARLFRSPRG